MSNPLLDFSGQIPFDRITPADVAPAVDQLLARANAALETVTQPDFPARWDSIARVLDVATEELGRSLGAVSHLNSVADTPELRAAYNAALPRVTEFWTRLGADERLYAKYKAIDPATLNAEQRQALGNAMRNFRLSGAELQGAAKQRFAAIQERQAELQQKFSENVLDATDAFAYYASADELEGVPADVVQAARAAAEAEGKEGCKLTLKMPCYLPVMQFARSSALRETLYRAYVTRASDQAAGDAVRFDNGAVMAEILALRQEEARLLGYDNFGQVSLVPKMAHTPEQVTHFLRDLARRARPFAEKDVADLRAFARLRLSRLRKRARRQAAAAATLEPTRLHALRIGFKLLRYGVEFFAPLFAARAINRYLDGVVHAQTALGFLQDVDIAHQRLSDWTRSNPALAPAAAFVLGWHAPRYARLRRRILRECAPLLEGRKPW